MRDHLYFLPSRTQVGTKTHLFVLTLTSRSIFDSCVTLNVSQLDSMCIYIYFFCILFYVLLDCQSLSAMVLAAVFLLRVDS